MSIHDKAAQLAEVLKRLNSGEDPAKVRLEAKELIEQLTPAELSLAEQQLVNGGVPEEHLRGLCSVHMEMLEGELQRFKNQLPGGHVITVMIAEHDSILGFLDELDDVNQHVQQAQDYEPADLTTVVELAELLLGAENHHQREEQVLFPAMEQRGVSGPPRIMRMEHEDLREMKHKVHSLGLAGQKGELPFTEFQQELGAVAPKLVFTLRDHIFKENNILYPTAMDVLQDAELWEDMQRRCDAVGYCSFTPGR